MIHDGADAAEELGGFELHFRSGRGFFTSRRSLSAGTDPRHTAKPPAGNLNL